MRHLPLYIKIYFVAILIAFIGCTKPNADNWQSLVPKDIPLVYVADGISLDQFLKSDIALELSKYTPVGFQQMAKPSVQSNLRNSLQAVLYFPSDADKSEAIFILKTTPSFADNIFNKFANPVDPFSYQFHKTPIYKVNFQSNDFFITQSGDYALLSTSSRGIENCLACLMPNSETLDISELGEDLKGKIILNTPYFDDVISQNAAVLYRPFTKDVLSGAGLTVLNISKYDDNSILNQSIEAVMPIEATEASELVASATYENTEMVLADYISANAAGFNLFRNSPINMNLDSLKKTPNLSELDRILLSDQIVFDSFTRTLGVQFGNVHYADSGYLEEGENLWMRYLVDQKSFYDLIEDLADDGLIERVDELYYVKSKVLAHLIGSPLSGLDEFYLSITYKVASISERIGLCRSITADRSRRRTIKYDSDFDGILKNIPTEFSSLTVTRIRKFNDYITPYLSPSSYVQAFTENNDFLVLFTKVSPQGDQLKATLDFYRAEESFKPYEEKWLFPISNDALSGSAVFGDIAGSSRDEIVFATLEGNVFALAGDGTIVRQMTTMPGDQPIGSPVLYDWYANNQNVILLAAGDKIYGWDTQGDLLPRFPISLSEQITTPLLVKDFTNDGNAELIVATNDRKLHVLNGSGNALRNWPITLNATVQGELKVNNWGGVPSIYVAAQNVLHAFTPDAESRMGFPIFLESNISVAPSFTKDHLFIGDYSGNLYGIGLNEYFNTNFYGLDMLFKTTNNDSLNITSINFSNQAIVSGINNLNTRIYNAADSSFVSDDFLIVPTQNGSINFINKNGQTVLSFDMGQNLDTQYPPKVIDIYKDEKAELTSISEYGRLFVWEIESGRRVFTLPSSEMSFPVFKDVNGDGIIELIANTPEGLRTWELKP